MASLLEEELSERFLRRVANDVPENISFEFTSDKAMLAQYYQMRSRLSMGNCDVWDIAQEDALDRQGKIIIARQGRLCVAGANMLICSPRNRLHSTIEQDGIDLRNLLPELKLEHTPYAEFSRFVTLPEFADNKFRLQFHNNFKNRAQAYGVQYCFILAPRSWIQEYQIFCEKNGEKILELSHIEIPENSRYGGVPMALLGMQFAPLKTFSKAKTMLAVEA